MGGLSVMRALMTLKGDVMKSRETLQKERNLLLEALKMMLHEFVDLPEMAYTEKGFAASRARRVINSVEKGK